MLTPLERRKQISLALYDPNRRIAGMQPQTPASRPPVPPRQDVSQYDVLGQMANEVRAKEQAQQQEEESSNSFGRGLGYVINNPLTRGALKPLEVLDIPRRVVWSTAQELKDLGYGNGFSPQDLYDQINPLHAITGKGEIDIGAGQVIPDTGNKWLDRTIGLAGDIAGDPLTYLSFGVAPVVGKAGRATKMAELLAAQRTAKGLSEGEKAFKALGFLDDAIPANLIGATEKAAKLGGEETLSRIGQRGLGSATAEQLAAMGLNKHGLRLRNPLTGKEWSKPIKGTENIGKGINAALGKTSVGMKKLPGAQALMETRNPRGYFDQDLSPAFNKIVTGKGPGSVATAVETIASDNVARQIGHSFSSLAVAELDNFADTIKQAGPEGWRAWRAAAARGEETPLTALARKIREDVAQNPLVNVDIPMIEGMLYDMPHAMTRDFRNFLEEALSNNDQRAEQFKKLSGIHDVDLLDESGFLQRRVFRPAAEGEPVNMIKIQGEEFPIVTGTVDELNEGFTKIFPEFKGKIYEENPLMAYRQYIRGVSKDVAKRGMVKRIAEDPNFTSFMNAGAAPSFDPVTTQRREGIEGEVATVTDAAPPSSKYYEMRPDKKATEARNKTLLETQPEVNEQLNVQRVARNREVFTQAHDNIKPIVENARARRDAARTRAQEALSTARDTKKAIADTTNERALIDNEIDQLEAEIASARQKVKDISSAQAGMEGAEAQLAEIDKTLQELPAMLAEATARRDELAAQVDARAAKLLEDSGLGAAQQNLDQVRGTTPFPPRQKVAPVKPQRIANGHHRFEDGTNIFNPKTLHGEGPNKWFVVAKGSNDPGEGYRTLKQAVAAYNEQAAANAPVIRGLDALSAAEQREFADGVHYLAGGELVRDQDKIRSLTTEIIDAEKRLARGTNYDPEDVARLQALRAEQVDVNVQLSLNEARGRQRSAARLANDKRRDARKLSQHRGSLYTQLETREQSVRWWIGQAKERRAAAKRAVQRRDETLAEIESITNQIDDLLATADAIELSASRFSRNDLKAAGPLKARRAEINKEIATIRSRFKQLDLQTAEARNAVIVPNSQEIASLRRKANQVRDKVEHLQARVTRHTPRKPETLRAAERQVENAQWKQGRLPEVDVARQAELDARADELGAAWNNHVNASKARLRQQAEKEYAMAKGAKQGTRQDIPIEELEEKFGFMPGTRRPPTDEETTAAARRLFADLQFREKVRDAQKRLVDIRRRLHPGKKEMQGRDYLPLSPKERIELPKEQAKLEGFMKSKRVREHLADEEVVRRRSTHERLLNGYIEGGSDTIGAKSVGVESGRELAEKAVGARNLAKSGATTGRTEQQAINALRRDADLAAENVDTIKGQLKGAPAKRQEAVDAVERYDNELTQLGSPELADTHLTVAEREIADQRQRANELDVEIGNHHETYRQNLEDLGKARVEASQARVTITPGKPDRAVRIAGRNVEQVADEDLPSAFAINGALEDAEKLARANPDMTDEALNSAEAALRANQAATAELAALETTEKQSNKLLADAASGKLAPVMMGVLKHDFVEAIPGSGMNYVMSREVRDIYKQMYEATMKEPGMFGKTLTAFTNFFKTYATMTPGFHVRNAMSATFMNVADGVRFRTQLEGVRLWREFAGQAEPSRWLANQSKDIQDAFAAAFASGTGGRFFESGVGEAVGTSSRVKEGIYSNRLTAASQKVGQDWVEGPVRLGMALDSVRRKDSIEYAVDRISRIHFDYSQVSDFDEKAKRLIPFWTFMSRNLPTQLTMMWTKPRVYNYYNSFIRNFSDPADPLTPEYWMQQGAFNTGLKLGSTPLYLAPDFAHTRVFEDVEKIENLGKGDVTRILSDMNPFFTAPIEYTTGTNLFTGFQTDPDKLRKAGPLEMPAAAIGALLGKNESGPNGLFVNERLAQALQSLIPDLDRANRLLPGLSGDDYRRGAAPEGWARYAGAPIHMLTEERKRSEARRQGRLELEKRAMERVVGKAG